MAKKSLIDQCHDEIVANSLLRIWAVVSIHKQIRYDEINSTIDFYKGAGYRVIYDMALKRLYFIWGIDKKERDNLCDKINNLIKIGLTLNYGSENE